jgi:hypothetical protein
MPRGHGKNNRQWFISPPQEPKHQAHYFEIQSVNLFEQARSAITQQQYDNIKVQLRTLVRDAFDAGRLQNA